MIKTINLKKVTMEGFKIYKDKREETFGQSSIFAGGNGRGKSTIADAICWAFTGRMYGGSKNIENGFLNAESSKAVVEALFVDEQGNERTIKRSFTEASGVSLWLDGKKISQKAMGEHLDTDAFLMAFNPLVFQSKKPAEARNLILKLVDVSVTPSDILAVLSEQERDSLKDIDLDFCESELKRLRKEVSDKEKDIIVAEGYIAKNLGEVNSTELISEKFVDDLQIKAEEKKLAKLSAEKPDTSSYLNLVAERSKVEKQISEVKTRRFESEKILKLENQKSLLLRELNSAERMTFSEENFVALEMELTNYDREAKRLQNENVELRSNILKIRQQYTFNIGDTCPACRQTVNEDAIVSLKGFVASQTQEHLDKGVKNKETIASLEEKTKALLVRIQGVKKENENKRKEFEKSRELKVTTIRKQISDIEEQIKALEKEKKAFYEALDEEVLSLTAKYMSIDIAEAKEIIDSYEMLIGNQKVLIDKLKKESEEAISFNRNVQATAKRIELLKNEVSSYEKQVETLKSDISALKDKLFAITSFNQAKIKIVEDNIKKSFDRVSFKIEEVNKETGEVTSCFKVLFDGKPIETCSLSEQMKAGMEITNMVQNALGLSYPVFLDNSESISEVAKIDKQLIRTVVVDIPNVVSIEGATLQQVWDSSREIVLKVS